MDNRLFISWNDIKDRAQRLIRAPYGPTVKVYGVPRGGQPIAAMFDPVDSPADADIIVDDLVDSGATKARFLALYPARPFIALFDKTLEPELAGRWLVFPWETSQEPFGDTEDNFRRILQRFGVDTTAEGLQKTPERYIRFMSSLFNKDNFNFTTFDANGYDEMIIEKNIPFYSLCEHHTLPFFGTAFVGYIPNGRIAGLSKLPRTVHHFAAGLQNQSD